MSLSKKKKKKKRKERKFHQSQTMNFFLKRLTDREFVQNADWKKLNVYLKC